ncbi:hypothetical protein SAY87_031887 [Trapa incisa]|uniref:Uncharacterized protein n=1 Tax=Trapa incisa TaxID=236973 RepID=A0AAN7KWT5_9MYRT|nr:hypothetical protein SAY87_031887 [Trapa incisa]
MHLSFLHSWIILGVHVKFNRGQGLQSWICVDTYVLHYVMELQHRLTTAGVGEVWKSEYAVFNQEAAKLEIEAYPVLDVLTSKISTLNLEQMHRLKNRLVALILRVQKVRDEIDKVMDDDGDMAEMYLTEKKRNGDQSLMIFRSNDGTCFSNFFSL